MLNEIMPKIKPLVSGYHIPRYSKRQIIEIMKSVDKMNALKGHQKSMPNKKYTEQYFRDLWGIHSQLKGSPSKTSETTKSNR